MIGSPTWRSTLSTVSSFWRSRSAMTRKNSAERCRADEGQRDHPREVRERRVQRYLRRRDDAGVRLLVVPQRHRLGVALEQVAIEVLVRPAAVAPVCAIAASDSFRRTMSSLTASRSRRNVASWIWSDSIWLRSPARMLPMLRSSCLLDLRDLGAQRDDLGMILAVDRPALGKRRRPARCAWRAATGRSSRVDDLGQRVEVAAALDHRSHLLVARPRRGRRGVGIDQLQVDLRQPLRDDVDAVAAGLGALLLNALLERADRLAQFGEADFEPFRGAPAHLRSWSRAGSPCTRRPAGWRSAPPWPDRSR